MKSKLSGEFQDGAVDWITVTARERETIDSMRSLAMSLLDNQHGLGNFGRPWFQSGYVGVACGHVQFGEREGSAILRLGGYMAKNYWRRAFEVCDNVTRIDLQTTVKTEEEPTRVIHRHYKELQRWRRPKKRAPKLARICEDQGGYTVYTGRRCSNVMGRIYDKAAQSKDKAHEGCVRYEVQFAGRRALLVASTLFAGVPTPVDIASAVLEFFTTRGALLRSLLEKLSHAVSIDTRAPAVGVTDAGRKLQWFVRSVAPSVRFLFSMGFREQVLCALGLNPAFTSAVANSG